MVRLLKIASDNNVRVKMIGDRRRFAQDIIDGINRLEEEIKQVSRDLPWWIAANYVDEIRRAAAKLRGMWCAGKVEAEDITESAIALSEAAGYPGSGSADPYQRRVKTVQLSAVAAGSR